MDIEEFFQTRFSVAAGASMIAQPEFAQPEFAQADSPDSRATADRAASLDELRSNLRHMQRGLRQRSSKQAAVSTGIPPLDDILPDHGLLRGTLSEWIAAEPGSGAASLALRVAGQAQQDGPLVLVDAARHFYAPAFFAAGVRPEDTILVRPESPTDELWALEQSLRCPGVGAVLCRIDSLGSKAFRRLQLAAESGTAIGLLLRPLAAQRQTGWADVRLLISPRSSPPQPSPPRTFCRRLEVRCVYAKGALTDRTVELDVCDETGAVRLAAVLSSSAAVR